MWKEDRKKEHQVVLLKNENINKNLDILFLEDGKSEGIYNGIGSHGNVLNGFNLWNSIYDRF